MILRWDAPDAATLERILADPSFAGRSHSTQFRDVYFDTSDGELRRRSSRCRLRFTATGDRCLTVWLADGSRLEDRVRGVDDMAALAGASAAAVRLRAL